MKEKFYFKLNLFDGIVLLVTLLIGGILAVFLLLPEQQEEPPQPTTPPVVETTPPVTQPKPESKPEIETTTVYYTIRLRGMFEGTADSIQPGDELFHNIDGSSLGEVITIDVVPATESVFNEWRNQYVNAQIPGYEDAEILVEAQRLVNHEGSLRLEGGYTLQVNSPIYVRCNGCMAAGVVIGIEREEQEEQEEEEQEEQEREEQE